MSWTNFLHPNVYSRIINHQITFTMAFSNAHRYDDAIYHFALLCNALSHPARVIILKRLIALHGEWARASELGAGLPLAKQTLSDHFKILREMSIVNCEVRHPYIYYSLNSTLMNTYVGIFSLVTQAELKYDENYVAETKILGSRRTTGTTPV
ncbi:MAG TPA: winged helix-turn-helix domain-containing protein [Saprospiraceae bacterium]|nr:winged helix-turn-helix domain-containing protein [Saprospiraceae bacterium]